MTHRLRSTHFKAVLANSALMSIWLEWRVCVKMARCPKMGDILALDQFSTTFHSSRVRSWELNHPAFFSNTKMTPSCAENIEKHRQKGNQTLPVPRYPGPCGHRLETMHAFLTTACYICLSGSSLPFLGRAYSLSLPFSLRNNQVQWSEVYVE